MRPILVIGGVGYIGSNVVLTLRGRGELVVVLDDLSAGHALLVPDDVELVVGDAADESLLAEIQSSRRPAAIMHFVAKITVPDSIIDPCGYYRPNTRTALQVISHASRHGTPLVFSSTAAVYGEADGLVNESAPKALINPYGRSKLMIEQILGDMRRAGQLASITLRYFNVAGADPDCRAGQMNSSGPHLLTVVIETALGQRGQMALFGNDWPTVGGTAERDFIHVRDLAQAHLCALDTLQNGHSGKVFNCCYGGGSSVLQVNAAVKRNTGKAVAYRVAGRRNGDSCRVIANSNLIRRKIRWQPSHDRLDAIVQHALN